MPKNIPWKLKSAAYSIIDVTGTGPLYVAQKHLTRRSRRRIQSVHPTWQFHERNLRANQCEDVLEFGAGKDLAQNLYLAARTSIVQTVVDLNPMLDLDLLNSAVLDLERLGVQMNGRVNSVSDLQHQYRISYHAPLDMQRSGFESGRFHACISTYTLEHIPVDVIAGIWRETYRVLRSGGIVSAVVDYSDHYAHTDRSISPLNYLTLSDRRWQRHNHRCHFQNRLRHGHHLGLLEEAGFQVELSEASDPALLPPEAEKSLLTGRQDDNCLKGYIVARHLTSVGGGKLTLQPQRRPLYQDH